MNLILLAGNSISNKEWIEEVEASLKPFFTKTEVHYYQHWSTGDELIDFEKELELLSEDAKDFGQYVIFAKSAGTLLTLKGVKEGKLQPVKCIFAGTAINWGREKNFSVDEWLENYSIPTLFIEKTNDPACSFEDLAKLLENKSVKNYSLKEITGSNHHYEDIELLKTETEKFIKMA